MEFKATHIIKRTNIPCKIIGKGSENYNYLCHIETEFKGDCWVEKNDIEEIA